MYLKGPTMHHTMGLFGGQMSSKQVYSHWTGCLRGLGVTFGIQGQSPDPPLGKVPLNLTHKSRSFTLASDRCLSPRLSRDAGLSHAHHLPGTPLQASV